MSSAPGSDKFIGSASINGDANQRMGFYVRGSDGYGGIQGGAGSSITSHLYAQATGWRTPESIVVDGGLTVSGSTSLAGLNTSGNATIGGTLTVTGNVSAPNVLTGKMSFFSGTGSQSNVAHGLGETPSIVIVIPTTNNGESASVDAINSTTCRITLSGPSVPWLAVAFGT